MSDLTNVKYMTNVRYTTIHNIHYKLVVLTTSGLIGDKVKVHWSHPERQLGRDGPDHLAQKMFSG